jgi:AraC-like DNA-binding protein
MREYHNEYVDFFYYTPSDIEKNFNLCLVRGGRNMAKPNYMVGPKRIDCYSMHFVREGKLHVECEGVSVELEKGDLFVMFPGHSYLYRTCVNEPLPQLNWIVFNGIDAEALLQLIGFNPDSFFRSRVLNAKLEHTIDLFFDRFSQHSLQTPHYALELQSLLYAVLAQLTPFSASPKTVLPSRWIQQAIDYMELQYMEGILIEQVASLVGMNRTYFSTTFTEQIGCSPNQYLQQLRMNKGKSLLEETNLSVTEIGISLGYPSLYAFTRAFKLSVGLSPQKYRASGCENCTVFGDGL